MKPRFRETAKINSTKRLLRSNCLMRSVADLPSRGVRCTVISKAVKVMVKEKAKKKLLHTTLFHSATEEDFEEAREVMSGEYSNLPVRDEIIAV